MGNASDQNASTKILSSLIEKKSPEDFHDVSHNDIFLHKSRKKNESMCDMLMSGCFRPSLVKIVDCF